MKLTGAQIIVEALIDQGCDTVFGYPGGSVLNLFEERFNHRPRLYRGPLEGECTRALQEFFQQLR